MKKKIMFTAPIHLKQGVKIKDGDMKMYFEWDIFERLFKFVKGLFPRIKKKEVGAVYHTLREGYYGIGVNGEIESLTLPSIDENTEELIKNIGLSICISKKTEDINDSIVRLEMNNNLPIVE